MLRKNAIRTSVSVILAVLLFPAWAIEQPIVTSAQNELEPSYVRLQNGREALAFSKDAGSGRYDIYFMLKDSGGVWGTPTRVPQGGFGDQADNSNPDLVELPGSRIMVVWSQNLQGIPGQRGSLIVYNIYSFVGGWDSCEIIPGQPESCFSVIVDDDYDDAEPSVIAKPTGQICVFYSSDRSGFFDIYYVCFYEDWTFPPNPTLMPHSSSNRFDYSPSAVVRDGLVYLAWDQNQNGVYLTANTTGWTVPLTLATSQDLDRGASLAVTGDGSLWLFWETSRDCCGGYDEFNIYYKRSPNPLDLASWQPNQQLTSLTFDETSPSAFDLQPGVIGIMFSTNAYSPTFDIYYTTVERKTGDTDWDGDVDIDDLVGTYLAQFTATPVNLYRYDIDRDGDIDLDDLVSVFLRQFT